MTKSHYCALIYFFLVIFNVNAFELRLQEGDIIGESEIIEDSSTAYIEAATQSRFGHVGLVLKVNNELQIAEEYPPSAQLVSIDQFLSRAPGKFAVIRNSNSISSSQLNIIRSSALELIKSSYPYNYSQINNDMSMNCSEFINYVFKKAAMIVGKTETIGQMQLKSFGGHPWRLWRLGDLSISKKDKVITPKSIMQTKGWLKIAGDIDPNINLTDHDLYDQWTKENATKLIAKEWYLFPIELKWLSRY